MIIITWSELKGFYDNLAPAVPLDYVELSDRYHVWATWRGIKLSALDVYKASADGAEFESSYKAISNIPEADKVRITNCKSGRKLHDRYVTFVTASQDNFDNTDQDGDSYGDITYWMRDINRDLTTNNSLAVQTVIDFYPTWDYEVSGGHLYIPPDLPAPKSAWELHIIGAPDIPAQFGGSLAFVANPRIQFREGNFFYLDSSLNPADISGSLNPYVRKIRWILTHPVGAQAEFQLNMKVFR